MRTILITQSNYIPWKGYFDMINQADVFVIFDDMQFTRRDWRNRNYIKTPQGLKWLTIPVEVKGKFYQKINETKVSDNNWNLNHLAQLKHNYSKAPCFGQVFPWVEELYESAVYDHLTDINVHFLRSICQQLKIKTEFIDSREFDLKEGKTERLVGICKELNAQRYITGPSASSYLDENLFAGENIQVQYFDFSKYPEYTQLHPPFAHGVSILDLILNEGDNTMRFISSNQ
jgi:hypothetical protein